jgi:hypothetical protein
MTTILRPFHYQNASNFNTQIKKLQFILILIQKTNFSEDSNHDSKLYCSTSAFSYTVLFVTPTGRRTIWEYVPRQYSRFVSPDFSEHPTLKHHKIFPKKLVQTLYNGV